MNQLRPLTLAILAATVLSACAPAPPADADLTTVAATPEWIWSSNPDSDGELRLRRTFGLAAAPDSARLAATCDNRMVLIVNGEQAGVHGRWESLAGLDVASMLTAGENTLEVVAVNEGGPAGLILRLDLGGDRAVVTDGSWRVSPHADSPWTAATVLGPVGAPDLPWSGNITAEDFAATPEPMAPRVPGGPQAAELAEELHVLPGFEAELLYSVPGDTQGSWVALATDPEGRIYASDQGQRGLFRITPATAGDPQSLTTVEDVPVDLSGAQGLCWAFDSLYANVSGKGVFRLRDTDGDGQLDASEHLIELDGSGEHGPHAVLPTPDGEGLYFIAGNHTLPPEFEHSRAPANWDEDLLLPRQWDPSGHARGRLAPGGWIARCDPDGSNIEIVSNGYRNHFDVALNGDGELFTYDSDMEWDLGLPWYRPTRICHATSGSEFGWRSGTGKWPTYYEDSLPGVLDIGPGSPTGLVAGADLAFPTRYQRGLLALDWTFGTIYAIGLEPEGASYVATKEEFVWSKPLALTDAVVGRDGALYFAVGGRGTQSALYRVRYAGDESIDPPAPRTDDAARTAREQRRALEAFHGEQDDSALDAAWPHLASADRFLRFAARIAVENQAPAAWRARALAEEDARARAVALVALARQGRASDRPAIVDALAELELAALDEETRLIALRAYALAFARHGEPTESERERARAALEALFPHDSAETNTELVRLLVYLDSEVVVAGGLELMRAAGSGDLPPWAELIERNDRYGRPIAKMLADMPPIEGIAYATLLRNATEGWTLPLRKAYFEFFVDASERPGGNSYARFLTNIRDDAADTLSPSERRTLAELLGESLMATREIAVTPPAGPGRPWTRDEAVMAVGTNLTERDFESGRNLYHAASCSVCHRFDGDGGAIGPDLTSVAATFAIPDLLEAIVDPNRAISDQYGSHTVTTGDGRSATGMLVADEDTLTVYPRALSAEPAVFERSAVTSIEESALSQMPEGLVDPLSEDELKDLIAYLMSEGDEEAEFFGAATESD